MKVFIGGNNLRNQYRNLLGVLCLATGITVILGLILPNWLWMMLLSIVLIGCGVMLFM
ncbi:2-oxoglutarate translocator [[Eubacterium] tenue]|uniref:2-oxoglutarate translocator n=1 Tax=Paeniclostridium hominis TaxID=2764329 RepID=A0ABR7K4G7_9FIRM|nr:2-oxoglutarate translocator [Paeniclostridium hominis]MBC8631045.1 2-oxoglutarate translocator [[Eubacterium] tenue]